MLAAMIQKIIDLKQTQTFEINGQTYSDRELERIPPHVDRPKAVEVNSLDSICAMVRRESTKVSRTVYVQAAGYNKVEVFSTYLDDFSRHYLYTARADVPGFPSGWRDREKAIIELRSLCIPTDGSQYLLDLLSKISDEASVSTTDNGVTQTVEARQGVALNTNVAIKPRVSIRPFRTFLEVPQPESEFILRVDKARGIGLIEADGGVWKLEAKRAIADYFRRALADMIESGSVIVMQ